MKLNALIIEDEPAAAKRMQKLIKAADPDMEILDVLDSVSSATKWFQTHSQPDVIFLDINLGDGNSFGIFDHSDIRCPIIFTTAYDQYAIKAFKLNSVDYLLKPIKADELIFSIEKLKNQLSASGHAVPSIREVIDRIQTRQDNWKKRFVVNFGDKIKAIETCEIAYFMILEKNTFLVTHKNDSYGINYSLEQLEELLNPDAFIRINRKYIVSFDSIRNMWTYSRSRVKLQLDPPAPDDVIVSTERSSSFKEWLNQ